MIKDITYIKAEERVEGEFYHHYPKGFVKFTDGEKKARLEADKEHEENLPFLRAEKAIIGEENGLSQRAIREAIVRLEKALKLEPSEVAKAEERIKPHRETMKNKIKTKGEKNGL